MVKIIIPVCVICKRPLSTVEQKHKVTAHLNCVFDAAYECSSKPKSSILSNGKRIYVHNK